MTALSLVTACSTTTDVELQGADAPQVELADGGQGQNDAEVVEAGAIALDDAASTTSAVTTVPSSTVSASTVPASTVSASTVPATTGPATTVSPDQQSAAMIDQMCSTDRRELRQAVDQYRADYGQPPTSEADLLATAYIHQRSDLYDVWVDGSVVLQGDTCA